MTAAERDSEPSSVRPDPDESTDPPAGERPSLGSTVSRLAAAIHHMSAGEQAELRRMEPSDVGTPAYWKLIVSVLQPAGAVGPGPLQESRERDWSVIIRAIALLGELHAPRVPLGHALASVGFSELRFVRLLRASGARLFDETIATARFLAAKGADVNALHLAQLVLTDTKESGEDIRRSIARSYYGTSLTPSAKEQNK